MASQAELLLWVLATLVVALAALNLPLGLRWAWGFFLQMGLVLALCVAGLTIGPVIPWALAAWAAFLLAQGAAPLLLRRFALLTMTDGDPVRAARVDRLLGLVSWGLPRRLRAAELEALRAARAGDRTRALALLRPFLGPDTPERVRPLVAAFAMSLFRFDDAWGEAIAFAEGLSWPSGEPIPHAAAFVTARAYLELGRFDEAVACMARADLANQGLPAPTLDVYRLPFYALIGDMAAVEAIARRLGPRQALLTRGWVVRCQVVQGRHAEAIAELKSLLTKLPAGSLMAERMAQLLERLEAGTEPPAPQPSPASEAAVRALFEGASSLFDARRPSRLVVCLMALNVGGFIGLYGPEWGGDRPLTDWLWSNGVMWMPGLLRGEWWRLFTHQFMHLHVTHLLLNMATLWVLGMLAVRLVGPFWFLPIYLAAGVAGALAQGALAPEAACLGASGAIFGALGIVAVAVLRDRQGLPQRWRTRFLRRLAAVLALQLAADWLIPGVAALDHLGGLVAGGLLTLFVPLPKPPAAPGAQEAPSTEAA
jgi:rhomboid protease GluP